MIPFYDVTHLHFNLADVPVNDQTSLVEHRITTMALHPHMSFAGF
jgi:hypothetical protein